MIKEARLQEIYTTVFTTMIRHDLLTLPLSTYGVCSRLGIELVPLSKLCINANLTAKQVFEVWGNEDGVVMAYDGRVRIGYNDFAPSDRARFTICEEVGHYLLGHLWDARFNVFSQDYDPKTYNRYEEEARTAAGLLISQPQFFYKEDPKYLNPRTLAYLCGVSAACAETRVAVLRKYRASIERNEVYRELPQPDVIKPFWRATAASHLKVASGNPFRPARYCSSAIIIDGPER